jgi:hypothetical protein
MVSVASFGSGLERYQGGSGKIGELVSTLSRLSAEVTALRVTQETQVNRQYTEAYQAGLTDRCMELQGKIEIADNQILSLQQALAGLRDDAKEQAEQDALVLTDAQLRNDG